MKLLPKFSLVLVGTAGLILLLLAAAIVRWDRAYGELFEHLLAEKESQTTGVLALKTQSLKNFAYDYSWWEDTIDFVKNPTDEWWTEEIEGVPALFEADLTWFYNKAGQLVYERNDRNEIEVASFAIPDGQVLEWMRDLTYPHFFAETPYGVIELAGSPLQPGEDLERTTPAQGMMFAGRFHTDEFVYQVEELTGSRVHYAPATDDGGIASPDIPQHHGRQLRTVVPLQGLDGEVFGAAIYEYQTEIFGLFDQHLRSVVFLVAAIIIVMAVALAFTLPTLVLNPIARLRASMTEQQERPLYPLLDRGDELGQLAQLVRDFFQQKRVLTQESAARAKAVKEAEEAAREARRLERVKSEFLATMSHEIRTPMNAVVGFSELLREGNLPEEEREYATIVVENSYALLHLLDDILDYSKLDSSRLELQLECIDLRKFAAQIVSTYQAKARTRNLLLTLQLDPRLPQHVEVDSARLRQILNNLVDNGIKFTERGSVRLSLEPEGEWRPGEKASIQFTVRDTGIGIRDEQQRQIFEPFTQADSSTTRRFGGTGLGLAISSRLVSLMGGLLKVDSAYGRGSTFSFSLALPTAGEKSTEKAGEQENGRANLRLADTVPLHILVVEDNPTSGQLIHIHLRRLGYQPVLVMDGLEALERVQKERFDLILLDLQMPRMDGWTFVNQLRTLPRCPWVQQVKLIAVSANKLRVETSALVIAGIHGFVSKPYTFGALVNEIRRVCAPEITPPEGPPRSRDDVTLGSSELPPAGESAN
ncbi:MAG: ATP-binding protein [Verrucomicrobiota bacterium JB022]|nr:ATP-binding protein [Verrucomicrobiota bacterium JB022]